MINTILKQRYKIIKELGSGGIGETFLAEDLDLPVTPKPKCVVKKLQPTSLDPVIIKLFEQEAQILYKFGEKHPQIPRLYAYFQENNQFYLIQELIEGKDLSQEIIDGKKLSESYAIRLLKDVLEILVYVHENNVIHRDIKPANIIRCYDGKIVLIDFGIVKKINTTIMRKSGYVTHTVGIGTPGYMPSEQAMGKPKLNSDIYALGVTIIHALTDIHPTELEEDEDGELIWKNQVNISENLEKFLSKMVRYHFTQRYKDAKEALEELNKLFPAVSQQNINPNSTEKANSNQHKTKNSSVANNLTTKIPSLIGTWKGYLGKYDIIIDISHQSDCLFSGKLIAKSWLWAESEVSIKGTLEPYFLIIHIQEIEIIRSIGTWVLGESYGKLSDNFQTISGTGNDPKYGSYSWSVNRV